MIMSELPSIPSKTHIHNIIHNVAQEILFSLIYMNKFFLVSDVAMSKKGVFPNNKFKLSFDGSGPVSL